MESILSKYESYVYADLTKSDMTLEIQDFIYNIKNSEIQSQKHILEDTKKILQLCEKI